MIFVYLCLQLEGGVGAACGFSGSIKLGNTITEPQEPGTNLDRTKHKWDRPWASEQHSALLPGVL